jgi:hypothetical protein
MACSSSLDDSSPSARHVFVLASSSGLRGHKRTYLTMLESADHALFKMVMYVLLRPLRPELDAKTKTCLAEGELSSRLDEQAIDEQAIRGLVFFKYFFFETLNK